MTNDIYTDVFDHIPEELRNQDIWVCFRIEPGTPKAKKKPYQVTGDDASCSDPATWTSFTHCVDAVLEGDYDALGFALQPPYVGIDFDNCIDTEIDPKVLHAIQVFDSYTEISTSGTGTHTLIKGELPAGHNRKGNVEMYSHARFFLTTGDRVPCVSPAVEYRQAELEALFYAMWPREDEPAPLTVVSMPVTLSDEEILDRAKRAKNGHQFLKLWTGKDVGDHSLSDWRLCCSLAFWTGNDPVRIDSLFRQSGLYRKKWNRRDYRERTIRRAIQHTPVTFGGK